MNRIPGLLCEWNSVNEPFCSRVSVEGVDLLPQCRARSSGGKGALEAQAAPSLFPACPILPVINEREGTMCNWERGRQGGVIY